MSTVRPGSPMVVNELVFVTGFPSAPSPVTLAWYAVEYFSGASGTQEVPSERRLPLSAAPPAGVSVIAVTRPNTPARPSSAETGTLAVPVAGVSVTANGLAGGAFGFGAVMPPVVAGPQPATRAAPATSATIVLPQRGIPPPPVRLCGHGYSRRRTGAGVSRLNRRRGGRPGRGSSASPCARPRTTSPVRCRRAGPAPCGRTASWPGRRGRTRSPGTPCRGIHGSGRRCSRARADQPE